ncbi:MAG: STAS domain-containing protein [Candidatus Eremiobacteraeota bacterium]|nr:STAS domain-containing protein [Candidatus Eremiobacteraeota bacterium]
MLHDALTETTIQDGTTVVAVLGEIDIASAGALREQLDQASRAGSNVVVSLEKCAYIDSSGLRVLVRISNELGDRFAIVVPPGTQTRRIFDITGLGYQMRVCDGVDQAVAALRET